MATKDNLRVLLVPGGGGSGPEHWHHRWASADPRTSWVQQQNWTGGTRADWVKALDREIGRSSSPTILAAHSLGAIVVAHWAAGRAAGSNPVVGALLVAPADIEASWVEPGSVYTLFTPIPQDPLPWPTVVAASTNDPVCSTARAEQFAEAWGARLEWVGDLLHVGSDADLGLWPHGRQLLAELEVQIEQGV